MNTNTTRIKSFLDQNGFTVKDLKYAICELQHACRCEFRELTPDELDDRWMSIGAKCLKCDKSSGWRCKESPDGVCHYRSRNGCVDLLGGELYPLPESHDKLGESADWCIFCGLPDERK
jgi:hypothetical protein